MLWAMCAGRDAVCGSNLGVLSSPSGLSAEAAAPRRSRRDVLKPRGMSIVDRTRKRAPEASASRALCAGSRVGRPSKW